MGDFEDKARIYQIIAKAESRAKVRLTVHAGEMLAIPVMEQLEAAEGKHVNWRRVEGSIRKIVATAKKQSSSRAYEKTKGRLNARAIIRAFWKDFCDIPPFCGPTGEKR
jgi:hypothetical protein